MIDKTVSFSFTGDEKIRARGESENLDICETVAGRLRGNKETGSPRLSFVHAARAQRGAQFLMETGSCLSDEPVR